MSLTYQCHESDSSIHYETPPTAFLSVLKSPSSSRLTNERQTERIGVACHNERLQPSSSAVLRPEPGPPRWTGRRAVSAFGDICKWNFFLQSSLLQVRGVFWNTSVFVVSWKLNTGFLGFLRTVLTFKSTTENDSSSDLNYFDSRFPPLHFPL